MSDRKTSHNTTTMTWVAYGNPHRGIRVNTGYITPPEAHPVYGVHVLCILRIYLWWSSCILDVENTALCGVYVPCILRIYLWQSLCSLYIYTRRTYLWWSLCTLYIEDVPLVEFMYLVYSRCTSLGVHVPCILRMYLWRSLCMLYLLACQMPSQVFVVVIMCDVFRALINSLVCWFCTGALGLVLFQMVTLR